MGRSRKLWVHIGITLVRQVYTDSGESSFLSPLLSVTFVCVPKGLNIYCMCAGNMEARRRHQMPWN